VRLFARLSKRDESSKLNRFRIFPAAFALLFILALSGCFKTGGDKSDAADKAPEKEKTAETQPGLVLDAATQTRLGLQMETPAPAQWQPVLHATGRVANPLALLTAATDYEAARTTAAASQAEWQRTQRLAAQDNASPRTLEAAQAAATRDALALVAARARFTADWGPQLAAQTNLIAQAEALQTGGVSLARLFLPAGVFPDPPPASATVYVFSRETNAWPADFADNLNVDPATQVQTLLFTVKQKLPPDAALVANLADLADLAADRAPVNGVVVPAEAILRQAGRGWVYVQTEANRFRRVAIPLDRLTAGGWFVAQDLSATNLIVVRGAQSVLSAELGAGGFTTGERD